MLPLWVSSLADICGILGLVISIVIWKSTNKIKDQTKYYKSSQQNIIATLKGHRDSIILDGLNTLDIRSKLRTELYAVLRNFGGILSVYDKIYIRKTIHIINKAETVDTEDLCVHLDYIIARFYKREVRK